MRGLSPVAASGGHSSSRCAGLSLSRPLLLRSTGSRRAGSVAVAHGPSHSAACGILPDQGSNRAPCISRQILNHCATREAPKLMFIFNYSCNKNKQKNNLETRTLVTCYFGALSPIIHICPYFSIFHYGFMSVFYFPPTISITKLITKIQLMDSSGTVSPHPGPTLGCSCRPRYVQKVVFPHVHKTLPKPRRVDEDCIHQ